MKKILVLNYEFPPLGGGGGVAAEGLSRGFINNGYEVDFLTSRFDGLPKNEKVDGLNVYRVNVLGRKERFAATFISMLTYLVTGFFKGIELCRKNEYEFINTHFVFPTGPLGFILSRLFHVKNVLSLHGGDICDPSKNTSPHRYWYYRLSGRFLINSANIIIAQSQNTFDNARKFYKASKEIEIVPLPYNTFKYQSVSRKDLGFEEDKKYVIGIGRLILRKNFYDFIRAIYQLDDSVVGVIIGDGAEKNGLKKLIDDLNMTNRIKMPGFVSEDAKFQYLENSDVYLLSSFHEGFGIVLQEAMQVGLPIVATNHGGQVDLVEDGKNGLLVEQSDYRQMAEAVKKIITDEELSKKFSEANSKKILEFDMAKISTRYLELIKRL